MKILIVEDDKDSLCMLETVLRSGGYEVVSAENGVEALEKLKKNTIEMIVSDILMPVMDGFQLCRECKKDDSLKRIPFVFYTATYTENNDEKLALNLGAEKFLIKPLEPDELLGTVKTVIEDHRNALHAIPKIPIEDKEAYLTEYNKRLVSKLEDKVLALEKEIKARKQADEEIRKLSHAVEQSTVIVTIVDIEGNIEYANPQFCQSTGYGYGEIIGKNPRILKSGETTPEEYRDLWKTITSGYEWRGEFHNKKKSGELYWESASISPIKNKEGKITHFLGIKEDITDRKRMEEDLKTSEETFKSIGIAANDAIIISDHNGCISFWNKAAEKLFGFAYEDVIDKKIHELIIPDNFRAGHIKGFKSFKNTGQGSLIGKTVELSAMRRDGIEFPAEFSLSSVKIRERWNAIAIIRDISVRKQSEMKIKRGAKKLEQALNGIINALVLTVEQRDPYTAGHQQRVSRLACAIAKEMGIAEDQVEGLRVVGVIHDIGKMHIPSEYLSKPGKLTESEYTIIKAHSQAGYEILKGIEFPWAIADIIYQHHEKMDGSGYPLGLSNGDILMEARILCVADVVEAMSSHRPYRPALGMDKALEEISRGKGPIYDADVVDACIRAVKENGFQFESAE